MQVLPPDRPRQAGPALHVLRGDFRGESGGRPRDLLPQVRPPQPEPGPRLRHLRRAGGAQTQARSGGVPGTRHDLFRAPQGDHPPDRVGQGSGRRHEVHPRREGAGGLLRRHPADDRQRNVHHQRHRARDRQPAAPQPRRLLLPDREGPLRRADHSLPRELGGVRVRRQEPAPRPHRSQAEVPGQRLPARPRHGARRGSDPDLLQVRSGDLPRRQDPAQGGAPSGGEQAHQEHLRGQGRLGQAGGDSPLRQARDRRDLRAAGEAGDPGDRNRSRSTSSALFR